MTDSNEPTQTAFSDDRVIQTVIRLVAEEAHMDPKDVRRETMMFEVLDSLGVTEVVMGLEDEFELAVPDADVDRLRMVGDVIDYIQAELRKPREPVSGASSNV